MGFDFSIFEGMTPSDRIRELKELILELRKNRAENYEDIKAAERLLDLAKEELNALEKKETELDELVEELEEEEESEQEFPLEELVHDVETAEKEEEEALQAYKTENDAYRAEDVYKENAKDAYGENKTRTAYQKKEEEDRAREAYHKPEPVQKTASEELKEETDIFKPYKP